MSNTLFPIDPPDPVTQDWTKYTCPKCGYSGGADTFDTLGATWSDNDGYSMLCPDCGTEFYDGGEIVAPAPEQGEPQ